MLMQYSHIPSNLSSYIPVQPFQPGQVLVSNRGLEHINCILPAVKNQGALFLGDVVCTLKTDILQKYQIDSILTCMTEPISSLTQHVKNHKILPIRDTLEFPISSYFKEAREFIQRERSKGHNVLVHCHAGVSRSAAIVCAYLMIERGWRFQSALDFVREKRYRAKPNSSFIKQLNDFWQNQLRYMNSSIAQSSIKKKILIIKLDEDVETHEELVRLECKRKANKINKITERTNKFGEIRTKPKRYDLSKKGSQDKVNDRNFDLKNKSVQLVNNQSLIEGTEDKEMKKEPKIVFKKCSGPQLNKSNVQIKRDLLPFTAENKSSLVLANKNTIQFNPFSEIIPHTQVPASHFTKVLKTPVKSIKIGLNEIAVRKELYQAPFNEIGVFSVQTTPKNNSRHTMTGNISSSYKQYY